jgi:Fic family protein
MKPYKPEQLPLDCIDWASHVRLIGLANASLARFDGIIQNIVNPLLLLSPLTTQEAVISSKIEGTQASMEEVLEFEVAPDKTLEPSKLEDIQEIINYRQAMGQAVSELKKRPLCLNLIKKLHIMLLDSVRGRNKAPGEFRRVQNFIGPVGCLIDKASFVPPSPELVNSAMDNWEKYVHYDEKDLLVQLAIVKAQFELIHPFLDGNGRMGRMLIPIFLYEKNLLSEPVFYLSEYFESKRDIYYERLLAISQQNDWNGWIHFFLNAVIDQANSNTNRAKAILGLYNRMKQKVTDKINSKYLIQAIDVLFSSPILTTSNFVLKSKIPKHSAIRIINAMKQSNIIVEIKPGKGRSPSIMLFPELYAIIEERSMK